MFILESVCVHSSEPERTWDQWMMGWRLGTPQIGQGTSENIMGLRWGTPPLRT